MSLFIKIISLYNPIHFLAILYPTSLANLVVEVGTRHSQQMLLGSDHIVYQIGQYLSEAKYCSIQSWPHGGLFNQTIAHQADVICCICPRFLIESILSHLPHCWWRSSQNKANLRDLIAATGLVISNWIQIINFSARVTVKFDGWPRKTIGHLFYATSSFVHHFVAIGEFELELQSGNAQSGSNSTIFRAVWPWNLTDDPQKQ